MPCRKETSFRSGAESDIMLWFLPLKYCALYIFRCLTILFKAAHLGGNRISSSVMTSWNAAISLSYFSSWKTEKYISLDLFLVICSFNYIIVNVLFLKTKFRPLFRCFLWTQPGASKQITWSLYEGGPSDGVVKMRTERKNEVLKRKQRNKTWVKKK